ncbi:hypothetical protein ACUB1S_005938, partial [Klebsiella michiganensis]
MSTYKTKNPLGSAAVKDLYDNAENVDKFVNDRTKEELDDRLGVLRKTWYGMEMIFSRFITYITGRGEQAVGAIGWQELGNWATGLTVDNRQQIVYYNGSWYKYLGELEHVITGDSPENDGGVWSAENPTGKWSNIGDAALRSNLGSGDGQKLIGEYSSISELRATTLDHHGQKVKVKFWDIELGTALVNVFYVYDANDHISVDDGYRTIVNAAGQRFKALLNDTLDLRIVGLRSYGDNLGTAFNRALNAELARVFAADSAMKMATIKLPALTSFDDPNVSTYNAILNASIVMPSYTPVECDGNYFCKFNPINDVAIRITNTIEGVKPSQTVWRNMQGVKMFANKSGQFQLVGPGATVSQSAGIRVGNDRAGDDVLDLRDLCLEDVQIRAFRYGLDCVWNDTYILTYRNLKLTGNYFNLSSLLAAKQNAGENIRVENTLLADSVSHQVYWNSPGINVTFDKVSIDYAGGSAFYFDNGARGCDFHTHAG